MKQLPKITIETLNQETLAQGFLGINRRRVKISYPQTCPTPEEDRIMTVDSVVRKSNDAVAVVPYFTLNQKTYVYLRSCIRPAAMLRDYLNDSGREQDDVKYGFWEIPAGLIDENEMGLSGCVDAAIRELHEEVGILVDCNDIDLLGPRYFSSAGMCAERIWFFSAKVNPLSREIPDEDGSALEVGGEVIEVLLTDALDAIEHEEILDAKTQMGLMRLAKKLGVKY
jgi:8-oxo-dGTP pyrophosphatase MutT (NUDIX family)